MIAQIPKTALYMANSKEDPATMMSRFKWVDNTHFKYITSGRVERVIDIMDNFREVNYNVIQNMNLQNKESKHFYDDYGVGLDDISRSLERIQDIYKSAYFMGGKRQIAGKNKTKNHPAIKAVNGLYPILF